MFLSFRKVIFMYCSFIMKFRVSSFMFRVIRKESGIMNVLFGFRKVGYVLFG